MQDSDANDLSTESLATQYATVQAKTTKSPTQQFGDLTWLQEPVGDFQGTCESSGTSVESLLQKAQHLFEKAFGPDEQHVEMVDSRDHDLHFAYQLVIEEGTPEAYEQFERELEHRQFTDMLFATHFEDDANAPEIPQDWECYRKFIESFEESCGRFSAYSLKYTYKLANMCDTKPERVNAVLSRIADMCRSQ